MDDSAPLPTIARRDDASDAAEMPFREALPPESPLAMPVQSLAAWDPAAGHRPSRHHGRPYASRLFVFGGALALAAYGGWQMYETVSVSGSPTALQYVLVALFLLTFSWIALAFTSAILGFAVLLRRPRLPPVPTGLATRTAILMPVYNEGTARTFAAIEAMREAVDATGLGGAFDWFVLSDSTQADAWIAEERAFLALRARLGADARLYYRHRPKNHHRKAGNIGDFVTRWGGAYDHMLVLDADSLMTGDSVVRLAGAMEADGDAGIIQTLPLIINRNTLFARVTQFAARIYGPVIATGLGHWSGRDGNYWGHNAIIRTKAFASACGLPDLPGKPPFGGHVLSPRFRGSRPDPAGRLGRVHAADAARLLRGEPALADRRGGARSPLGAGQPPARADHRRGGPVAGLAPALRHRHRRLRRLAVLAVPARGRHRPGAADGLREARILHQRVRALPGLPALRSGACAAALRADHGHPAGAEVPGAAPRGDRRPGRRACGGGGRLILSCLIEILLSALIAPIAMVIQSGSVFSILLGRDTGWNPQRRDDGSIPFADIVRRHRWHTVLGLVAGIAAFAIATSLFLWMAPTILGLVLAIPISWASGQLDLGLALKRRGLLMTPEERDPPAIAARAGDLAARNAARGLDEADALQALHADPDARGRPYPHAAARRGASPRTDRPRPHPGPGQDRGGRDPRRDPHLALARGSAWPSSTIAPSSTSSPA